MYLHIGSDTVLHEKAIIGIFDLDNTTSSKITRDFLNRAEKAGETVYVSDDLPKSFVLCEEEDRPTVYLTLLGSAALQRRAEDGSFI